MRILIVEDDYVIASGLAGDLVALGTSVLGPFRTEEEAEEMLASASAAILDIRIRDGTSFRLADQLRARRVPFLFYSGVGEPLPPRLSGAHRFPKPTPTRRLLAALRPELPPKVSQPLDIVALLPTLRLRARSIIRDPTAADRLIEMALRAALLGNRAPELGVEEWLLLLLDEQYRRHGLNLMN